MNCIYHIHYIHVIHIIYIYIYFFFLAFAAIFLNLSSIASQILLCPIYPKVSFSAFSTYVYQKVEQGRSCMGVLPLSLPLISWPQHNANSVQNLARGCFSHIRSGSTYSHTVSLSRREPMGRVPLQAGTKAYCARHPGQRAGHIWMVNKAFDVFFFMSYRHHIKHNSSKGSKRIF